MPWLTSFATGFASMRRQTGDPRQLDYSHELQTPTRLRKLCWKNWDDWSLLSLCYFRSSHVYISITIDRPINRYKLTAIKISIGKSESTKHENGRTLPIVSIERIHWFPPNTWLFSFVCVCQSSRVCTRACQWTDREQMHWLNSRWSRSSRPFSTNYLPVLER